MTDAYEPPRPRDDALQAELDALREQERAADRQDPEERARHRR